MARAPAKGKDVKQKDFLASIAEVAASLRQAIEAKVDDFDPDPAASAERRRRAQAADGFPFFAETYFPHHVRGQPSRFHDFLHTRLPAIVAEPDGLREVIGAPRGNAKTTYGQIFILWCIASVRKRFPVIISDATEQAAVILEGIKAELEVNPRLAMDFPELAGAGATWQVGVAVTRTGAKLQAFGSGKRLRGVRHGAQRPDLVWLDDIENDDNVRSPEQRDKLEGWIDKAVDPLGPPDDSMDIVYVGTMLHYDAVLARKIKNPMWRSTVFRAVMRWPDRMDLWERWEEILRNEGEPAADAFHAAHRVEMDEGAEVLWPAVQPFVRLMKIKVRVGQNAFDSEYQNDPINEGAALFGKVQFWVQAVRHWVHFGACDPSLGKQSKRHDPSAILVGALDRETGIVDVVEASIRRRVPDRIIEDVISAQAEYRCLRWGIEVVQFQAFLASELVKRSAQRGVPVPACGLMHEFEKELRIESMQPHVNNGLVRFRADHTELLNQLRHYPNADHDDGPDCLEMLWRVIFVFGAPGQIRTGGQRAAGGGRRGFSDFMGL